MMVYPESISLWNHAIALPEGHGTLVRVCLRLNQLFLFVSLYMLQPKTNHFSQHAKCHTYSVFCPKGMTPLVPTGRRHPRPRVSAAKIAFFFFILFLSVCVCG